MDSENIEITINIVQGQQGAEFDQSHLQVSRGAFTVWINQTDAPQVILPDNQDTRRTMTLAPNGQEGSVWMMKQVSSQIPPSSVRTLRWRLQSNASAHITITTINSVSDRVS